MRVAINEGKRAPAGTVFSRVSAYTVAYLIANKRLYTAKEDSEQRLVAIYTGWNRAITLINDLNNHQVFKEVQAMM
jgi:hypothetical protein